MGKLTNLNPPAPIADADLPASIARHTEIAAAMNAHLAAADPHPGYLTETEANNIFFRTGTHLPFFARAGMSAALASSAVNSLALSWNSVQPGQGIAEFCNYAGGGAGDAFNFFRVPSTPTGAPTLSNRLARIDINGAYIQVSDGRLKGNFLPAPGLRELLALSPKRYQQRECLGCDDDNKKVLKVGKRLTNKIGFIAQEVQRVLPEAVPVTTSEEELYGIDYACILTCAVRAIQELTEHVTELRAQVQELTKV
jgi:hypothetical protein